MAERPKKPAGDGARATKPPARAERAPAVMGRDFAVVGVGASAGGLASLQELLSHVSPETPAAFVVVTHQHPGHRSLLPELLQKSTKLSVREASDGEALHPGCVHVAPPRAMLSLMNGALHFVDPPEHAGSAHLIDAFFRSLAKDCQDRSVGVVLSGTGSDGTLGLAAIKGEGGVTMAEDLRSAAFTSMPEHAIQSGNVDHVLPAAGLAQQIAAYLGDPRARPQDSAPVLKDERKLLALLRARTGHDFTHYKKNTVRRRIERRMGLHRVRDLSAYLRYLQDNPAEIDTLYKELLIGVTSFFRDPETFDALATVLARLIAARSEEHPLRLWVPGCSTGEEAYSLAILLRELMERAKKRIPVRLFATDVDTEAIDHARSGAYPSAIVADVSVERLQRYFTHEDDTYRVIKDLRDMIVFAPHNLLTDPPFTRLDLLSCRNVLIYMDAELQDRLMTLFHYALRPGGHLFLGSSESIGAHESLFSAHDKKAKIYTRKQGSGQPRLANGHAVVPPGRRAEAPVGAPAPRQVSLPTLAATLLLQTHVPPSVLVNDHGDVVYIHGSTGPFLEPAQGQPSLNVVHMARDGLKLDLEAVLRAANAPGDRPVERLTRVKDGRAVRRVRVVARRVTEPDPLRGLLLVTFESLPPASGKDAKADDRPGEARGAELEEELHHTKQSLERTIEQLQASNEELQSANEELSSMNEELQSANEELEISKEETQALNEELHTVNAELRGSVDDLSRTNDDMTNLLNATEIATIFLDRSLRVRRFTTHATRVIHLISTDVGRPLADIMPKVKYDRLVADAAEVFRTLVPKEVELESKEGGWFLMRLLPYRTAHEQIDGLVMTFVDVTKVRDVSAVAQARAFAERVVQAVREPLVVLDGEARVLLQNRAFRVRFGAPADGHAGKLLYEVDGGRWDLSPLRAAVDRVLVAGADVEDVDLTLGSEPLRVRVVRLHPSSELPHRLLLTFSDARESSLLPQRPA